MNRLSLRIYVLLFTAACWLRSFAQDDDDEEDIDIIRHRHADDMQSIQDYMDYQPIHIRFSDVMMILLILVLCYVFGKIWKGCSYLILIITILFYFYMH